MGGILHTVPLSSATSSETEAEFVVALRGSEAARVEGTTDTGVFASDDDYRVPDVVVFSRDAASHRDVDGAPEVVIEVRSPHDETYEQVLWYLDPGRQSGMVIARDTLAFSLYAPDGLVGPGHDGSLLIEPLDVRITHREDTLIVDGEELEL